MLNLTLSVCARGHRRLFEIFIRTEQSKVKHLSWKLFKYCSNIHSIVNSHIHQIASSGQDRWLLNVHSCLLSPETDLSTSVLPTEQCLSIEKNHHVHYFLKLRLFRQNKKKESPFSLASIACWTDRVRQDCTIDFCKRKKPPKMTFLNTRCSKDTRHSAIQPWFIELIHFCKLTFFCNVHHSCITASSSIYRSNLSNIL